MTLQTVHNGGREISTRTVVAGEDLPWVVFSNSLLTDMSLWQPQVEALAGRANVLLYDQHGHGASPPAADRIGLPELADDLISVLDHHGLSSVTFAGVSMGVPTGLAAYARRPGLFGRMILINGQAKSSPDGREVWSGRVEAARGNFAGFCNGTMRRWLAPEVADGPQGQRLLAMMTATPFAGFESCAWALGDFDAMAGLEALAIPVLAIAGRNDTALHEHMAAVFAGRIGLRFEVIDNAGHLANYETPAACNALIADFLGLDTGASA